MQKCISRQIKARMSSGCSSSLVTARILQDFPFSCNSFRHLRIRSKKFADVLRSLWSVHLKLSLTSFEVFFLSDSPMYRLVVVGLSDCCPSPQLQSREYCRQLMFPDQSRGAPSIRFYSFFRSNRRKQLGHLYEMVLAVFTGRCKRVPVYR